jgi:hypothetical protein
MHKINTMTYWEQLQQSQNPKERFMGKPFNTNPSVGLNPAFIEQYKLAAELKGIPPTEVEDSIKAFEERTKQQGNA